MAKFNNKHLKLKDNQRAYFGTSDDASLWFDGSEMRSSATISGTTANEPYHLVQKFYIDNALITITGSTAQEDYEILITNIDSPYYVTSEDYIIFCDTTSGSITINLPAGTGGRAFNIKNIGAANNDVVMTPSGTEEIFSDGPGTAFNIKRGEVFDIHFNSVGGWW